MSTWGSDELLGADSLSVLAAVTTQQSELQEPSGVPGTPAPKAFPVPAGKLPSRGCTAPGAFLVLPEQGQ